MALKSRMKTAIWPPYDRHRW